MLGVMVYPVAVLVLSIAYPFDSGGIGGIVTPRLAPPCIGLMAMTPACHVGDSGSIPGYTANLFIRPCSSMVEQPADNR